MEPTRRKFIGALGALGAFATAGCGYQEQQEDDEMTERIGTPKHDHSEDGKGGEVVSPDVLGYDDLDTETPFWDGEKHADNPVIARADNPDATREEYQPSVMRVGGTFYCYTKSDEYGGAAGYPHCFNLWTSDDGVNWSLDTHQVFTEADSTMDVASVQHGHLLYEPETDTYHLYYGAYGGTDGPTIGHASGSDIRNLSDDAGNPFLTPTEIQNALGGSKIAEPRIKDVVIRDDGTHLFYGQSTTSNSRGTSDFDRLWVGTGSSYTDITVQDVIVGPDQFPRHAEALTEPTVFKEHGVYYLITGVGRHFSVDAEDIQETYALVGDGINFDPVPGVVADTGATATWEESRVYGGSFLKKQEGGHDELDRVNGKVRLYYNGMATGTSSQGEVGLVEFDEVPYPDQLPAITCQPVAIHGHGETTASTALTANNKPSSFGVRIPAGAVRARFAVSGKNDTAGETTSAALALTDAEYGDVLTGQSRVDISETLYVARRGPAFAVPNNAEHAVLELWVTAGTGTVASGAVLTYNHALRPDPR